MYLTFVLKLPLVLWRKCEEVVVTRVRSSCGSLYRKLTFFFTPKPLFHCESIFSLQTPSSALYSGHFKGHTITIEQKVDSPDYNYAIKIII